MGLLTCFVAGRVPGRACYGGYQWHHIIPQQAIKRHWRSMRAEARRGGPEPWTLTLALYDKRNRLPVCSGCHLGVLETGKVHVEPADLPRGFWEFVREYDLGGAVPRHLAERWVA